MNKNLNLSYRKIRLTPTRLNCNSIKIVRQMFSKFLVDILTQKVTVINMDQSSFDRTNFLRRCWQVKGKASNAAL